MLWAMPEVAGWLQKKSKTSNTWKRRFFVLQSSNLFFFATNHKVCMSCSNECDLNNYQFSYMANIHDQFQNPILGNAIPIGIYSTMSRGSIGHNDCRIECHFQAWFSFTHTYDDPNCRYPNLECNYKLPKV